MKTPCLGTLIGGLSLVAGQTSPGVAQQCTSSSEPSAPSVVTGTAGALQLAQAVNCSGGTFSVAWVGSATVEEAIHVREGTSLNVTAWSGDLAVADGTSEAALFRVDEGGTLHLSDLTLTNGRAENGGGAVLAVNTTVTLNSCTFLDNAADFGGGLLLFGSELVADDVNFVGNSAGLHGGAMYAVGSQITLGGSVYMKGNSAGFNGGAVYAEASQITLERSDFIETTAEGGENTLNYISSHVP